MRQRANVEHRSRLEVASNNYVTPTRESIVSHNCSWITNIYSMRNLQSSKYFLINTMTCCDPRVPFPMMTASTRMHAWENVRQQITSKSLCLLHKMNPIQATTDTTILHHSAISILLSLSCPRRRSTVDLPSLCTKTTYQSRLKPRNRNVSLYP